MEQLPSSYIHFDTGKTTVSWSKWRMRKFKPRRILIGVRFVTKENPVYKCLARENKNYFIDCCKIIEGLRVLSMFPIGSPIRKEVNTIEECREFLKELKKKYGKKNSKFIIKNDELGVLR